MKGGSRKLEGCRWSEKLTFQLSYRLDGSIDGGLKKQGRLEKRVQLEKTSLREKRERGRSHSQPVREQRLPRRVQLTVLHLSPPVPSIQMY